MRKNTVTWVDGNVLTKLMGNLQVELMDWQKFATEGVGRHMGDQSVLVAAIELRNRLDGIISRSALANAPKAD